MGGCGVTLQYCNVAGDVVTTTWEQARADLIIDGLPIRIPPTYQGQRSYPGLFWTATNCRTLVYESLLELDRLWLADFDPTVTGIATQPFQITGRDGAAQRSHVPDVLLVHADRRVTLVDVKPAAFLKKPAVRAQFDWTRGLCRVKGWQYEVFSGADATVLRNIKFLATGRRPGRLPPGQLDQARAALGKGKVALGEVLAHKPVACDESSWRVAVLACLWSWETAFDPRQALSAETILSPSTGVAA
ncbi:TnsA-like heteromeric transposase endonuclease subunit [Cellulomonas sp. ATA003]|uniref:TnsA-like heteromeric transposase endonuclease subunit n=1 Tax=Cellulomonas sp. ATA003 TaxID=3073064 RepID=UPI002873548E|nr:TnsA-like heteromeric transposase endonuclease subunit [Cellulomonas sp. ATA003]WNB85792.1 TnsA-like heteromeric transposase endonuclease subunit [Cellulomonas sp. ATA003]